jgi:hypothetical protein
MNTPRHLFRQRARIAAHNRRADREDAALRLAYVRQGLAALESLGWVVRIPGHRAHDGRDSSQLVVRPDGSINPAMTDGRFVARMADRYGVDPTWLAPYVAAQVAKARATLDRARRPEGGGA